MTASFYSSIAKACIWQSKYRTNSTNNNLEKFSYITNNESRIFIQEETNFITNLFTWCSFEFIISFMLSGDDFLSKSGIIRLIWLIKACLCTEYLLHWKRKWIVDTALQWFRSYLLVDHIVCYLMGASQRISLYLMVYCRVHVWGRCFLQFNYASELFEVVKRHLPDVHAHADDNQLYISFKPGSTRVNWKR